MTRIALCAALVLWVVPREQDKIYSNSYKGKAPPNIKVKKDNLVNAKKDLDVEKLKGRVVWLEFSFLG